MAGRPARRGQRRRGLRSTRKRLCLFGAAMLATAVVAGPTPASAAQQTLSMEIQHFLGSEPGAQGVPAFSQRFMAPQTGITVHKGDNLRFTGEFATAVAIPVNTDPAAWLQEHASFGGDFALQIRDPDEGLTSFKYNLRVIFPTASNCGPTGAPPCVYDGSTALGSGALFNFPASEESPGGFTMTINANPGNFFYLVNPVNPPIAPLKVTVVSESETATTQADIDSAATTLIGQDVLTATNLYETYANRHRFTRKNGHKIWKAWAGVDGPGVSVFDEFPSNLNVKKGDKVRVQFDQLIYEIHTGTFPKSLANEISGEDFAAVCDPDGDGGGAPDTAATFDEAGNPSCPQGTQLEADSTPRLIATIGNGVWNAGNDGESSGARSPLLPSPPTAGAAPFDVKFGSGTADTTVKWACAVHPFMVAKINVK